MEEIVYIKYYQEPIVLKTYIGSEQNGGSQLFSLIDRGEANEHISALRVITSNVSGKIIYADKRSEELSKRTLGISIKSAAPGEYLDYVIYGIIEDSSWSWDISKNIFLGYNGALVQTIPLKNEYVVQIAKPISSQKIKVEIGQTYKL